MALHQIPESERAEHFTTAECPCTPTRITSERPDHMPGALLIHRPFRTTRNQAAPVER